MNPSCFVNERATEGWWREMRTNVYSLQFFRDFLGFYLPWYKSHFITLLRNDYCNCVSNDGNSTNSLQVEARQLQTAYDVAYKDQKPFYKQLKSTHDIKINILT